MKILVTGATGMLGHDFCKILSRKQTVVGLSRGSMNVKNSDFSGVEFDVADIAKRENVIEVIVKHKPDLIIHCAAISDVDYCELNPEIAFKINTDGTKNVADSSEELGAYLISISTDYVFDGEKKTAYLESDKANPINIYGKSKLEAEEYIQANLEKFLIIRSSWMFGTGRKNFVDSILDSAINNRQIRAISDKFGSPTYTIDLVMAISDMIDKIAAGETISGIYHITNAGICSRYEFAKEILGYVGINREVMAIQGKDAGGKAARPQMSALDNLKIKELLNYSLRHYREAFKDYLQNKEGK